MIYVPGLLCEAESHLDYLVTDRFSLESLYRDLLKITHLSGDCIGKIKHLPLSQEVSVRISNVLCGPITQPKGFPASMTLVHLLCALRDLTLSDWKSYTLE